MCFQHFSCSTGNLLQTLAFWFDLNQGGTRFAHDQLANEVHYIYILCRMPIAALAMILSWKLYCQEFIMFVGVDCLPVCHSHHLIYNTHASMLFTQRWLLIADTIVYIPDIYSWAAPLNHDIPWLIMFMLNISGGAPGCFRVGSATGGPWRRAPGRSWALASRGGWSGPSAKMGVLCRFRWSTPKPWK